MSRVDVNQATRCASVFKNSQVKRCTQVSSAALAVGCPGAGGNTAAVQPSHGDDYG